MDAGGLLDQDCPNPALALRAIVPPKPERKRKKLKLGSKVPETSDIAQLRQKICEHKRRCQEELKEVYRDNLIELFYLQNGLNFIDVQNLKRKPNAHLKKYLASFDLEEEKVDGDDSKVLLKLKVEPGRPDHMNESIRSTSYDG